ncbi:hypothetical protein [Phaeodactylibacter xiamenensis]|uniref:hypothetical protein n=1 Tax=Phaeodactylibacter xiamenensis TaxID=1524460 RepID=UPI0024A9DD02|nr:hypothetical protein [Phaeodactylibacter xiamenensis]
MIFNRAPIMLLLMAFWACSKDAPLPEPLPTLPPSVPANQYLQLSPGNAWVYQSRNINLQTGDTLSLSKLDSIHVASDTFIDRALYHVQKGTRLGAAFESVLRVSGPEAVDTSGQLYFSTQINKSNFSVPHSLLPENAQSATGSIDEGPVLTTAYGTYATRAYSMEVALYTPDGDNPEIRYDTLFFAQDVGLLRYVQHHPSHDLRVEMDLLRAYLR